MAEAVGVVADRYTVAVALALGRVAERQAYRDGVCQPTGGVQFGPQRCVGIDFRTRLSAEFVARRARRDLDHTSGGVAAEQGALRTFQHRDLFNIDELAQTIALLRQIYAVDVQRDRVFHDIAGRADPANERLNGARRGPDVESRRNGVQLEGAVDPAGGNFLTRCGGDRNRHLLQILGAFLCGYDDFVEAGGVFHRRARRILGNGRR